MRGRELPLAGGVRHGVTVDGGRPHFIGGCNQFLTENGKVLRRLDANPDNARRNANDRDGDLISDQDFFSRFSRQDEHCSRCGLKEWLTQRSKAHYPTSIHHYHNNPFDPYVQAPATAEVADFSVMNR